jgi:outer membrane murein-binding lipoprotein Lpp
MMQKLIAVIVLIVVASLSIAGCTSSTNSNQTPSAASSAAPSAATPHDFLEKYLTAYKNDRYSNSSIHVQAWQLDWINSTSARVQLTALDKSTNITGAWDRTYMVFPTTQDATNYVMAMNLTAYSLASTVYTTGGVYQNVTGHAPQIYKQYEYSEGSVLIGNYKLHEIQQVDNIVIVGTGKSLS